MANRKNAAPSVEQLGLHGSEAYDARIKLSEVSDGIGIFIPNDTKRRKQLKEFVGIEYDSTSDRSSLRCIAMETLHNNHAARTQRPKH